MSRGARGFTLPEVMVSLAAMGAFGAAVTSVTLRVRDEQKVAAGRESDLVELRHVARLVEADVRAGLDLDDAGWHLRDGVLSRDGVVVARSVARFDWHPQGDCLRVRLTVTAGANEGPRREGEIDWVIRPRAAAGAK